MCKTDQIDARSVCVLAEPVFGSDGIQWRGMAFVGGRTVNNIIGTDRAVVITDCLDAVEGAGVDLDTEPHE